LGGLVILKSYSSGNVTGGSYVGGLIGVAEAYTTETLSLTDSWASGTVSAQTLGGGGIIGYAQNGNITIARVFSLANLVGSTANVKGLIYDLGGGSRTISNSFWRQDATYNVGYSDGTTGVAAKTDAQMLLQATYTGFDFVTTPVWKMAPAISNYPSLNWQ
jgi:hypothetical protein